VSVALSAKVWPPSVIWPGLANMAAMSFCTAWMSVV
jgi:hypothetical protein